MGFTRPLSEGGSLLEQWRSVVPAAPSHTQREEGREVTVAPPFPSGEKRSTLALVQLVEDEPPHLLPN